MSSPQTAPVIRDQPSSIPANLPTASSASILQRSLESAAGVSDLVPKRTGYGLPCSKCKTYFAADLTVCPVCKCSERIAPIALIGSASSALTQELPDPEVLEQERERFLREFEMNVAAAKLEAEAAGTICNKGENHGGGSRPATVCQSCYDHLQERVEVLQAALHMNLKEAAEVIYDAVWSDPSDPSKTYVNAASAILAELRRRSGVTPVFGPLQPLAD
jgi:hypothetical protein